MRHHGVAGLELAYRPEPSAPPMHSPHARDASNSSQLFDVGLWGFGMGSLELHFRVNGLIQLDSLQRAARSLHAGQLVLASSRKLD